MLMLQQLDPTTKENLGGLFINPDFISEIIPVQSEKCAYDGSRIFWCQIVMNNGGFYLVPFGVMEITDMLRDYNRLIGKYPTPTGYRGV